MQIDEQKVMAYWKRPGGPFKTAVAVAGLAIGGLFLAPILATIAWNLVNLCIAGGALMFIWFLATNKRVRYFVQAFWDALMNILFGWIFTWDPFVLWREDIKDMEKEREKASASADDVAAQKENIKMKIDEKAEAMNRLVAKAKAAQKSGMVDDLAAMTDTIQGYQEYIKQLTPMLANLQKIEVFLDKFERNAARMIQSEKTKLDLKIDLYATADKGSKAIGQALRFFKGDPEKKALLEQSAAAYRQNVAGKLANMKRGLAAASQYMRSIDLDRATSEEQGLTFLNSLDPDKDFKIEVPDELLPKEKRELGKVDNDYYDKLLKS